MIFTRCYIVFSNAVCIYTQYHHKIRGMKMHHQAMQSQKANRHTFQYSHRYYN